MRPVLRRGSDNNRPEAVTALLSLAAQRLLGTLDRVERAKAVDHELVAVIVEPGAANRTRSHGLILHPGTFAVASHSASQT